MVNKDDILEALGLREASITQWLTPALVGFGVGAFLGAGIALLFAPKAGAELRGDIMDRGRRVVERGREQLGGNASPAQT